jgi:dolichyl-phosphate-mannose-protein mannosyltransferase
LGCGFESHLAHLLLSMIGKFFLYWDFILLSVLSFFTRFWHLSYPAKVVFDETHFGLYASKYFSHQYYFDIHPPLGKLLFALSGVLGKIRPDFYFDVGSLYGDFNFLALRFLPALLGSLLIPLLYLLVREVGFSRKIAFLSGFLILFDNALIVQSGFILMDIILLFFIFLSFYLFFLAKRFLPLSRGWLFLLVLTGISLGATFSIKWTGLGALAVIWFLAFRTLDLKDALKKENLIKIFCLIFLPFLVYFLGFIVHFYLVYLPCEKNCGAVLDKTLEDYRLEGSHQIIEIFTNPPSGNVFSKFLELNKQMLMANLGTPGTYYYQSDWYTWPLMIRPMPYYLEKRENGKTSYIYLLGNPFVWWFGVIGVLGYLYLIIKNYFYKFRLKLPQNFYSEGCEFLFLGYLFFLLPFAAIQRFMIIYHYLPALLFSVMLLSVFFEGVLKMIFKLSLDDNKFLFPNKKANILFFGLLVAIFLSFLFFSPLTYGFPLTDKQFKARMWFDAWGL